MPPLLPRSKKLRTASLVAGSLVFVAIVAAILVSLASGDKHSPGIGKSKRPSGTTTAAKAKNRPTKLALGRVVVQNTGFPTAVSVRARRAVMNSTQRYFDDAIQGPLRHGKVDKAYSKAFDAGVKASAASRDRATLTDSATGPIRGPVRIDATRVRIDGLGDPTGKLTLLATSFTLRVIATTPTGRLTIKRSTELTFANESGRWLVTAYNVSVQRSIGKKTTSTTAHSGKTTTT
ncbi:MAG: hypothetical protein QOG50_3827 [Actinomycetota bacterium]|nr:hypothetical protein [Actinomycetota bacterium]